MSRSGKSGPTGRIDEECLSRAHRELTSVSPKELTKAAARVWRRLFGPELPALRHAG
ncbi:MAG: hypothetical protein ACXW2I_18545 [Burkholderiales bacterium]